MEKKWGYASSDEDGNLTYTRYEEDGSVNRYSDNRDGGHSHERWEDSNDYNSGKDSDWSRSESNRHGNPSTGEVQERSGCYLTSACMKHYLENFNDNCYELSVLRWFRDNFVSKEDKVHYYQTAPIIVSTIEAEENRNLIYDYIYDNIIDYCVKAIENGDYASAYERYRSSILNLEESFARKPLHERFARALRSS